jgi:hypothetical protein
MAAGWQSADPCAAELADAMAHMDAVSKIGRLLLQRIVDIYAMAGVELPPRRIWAAGEVPFDCNELIVSLSGIGGGTLPNAQTQPSSECYVPITARYNVTVVRCIPVPDSRGNPPSPEDIGAAADVTARDAYLLMKSACVLDLWGADVDPDSTGGAGVEAEIAVGDPQGGMQAVTLTVTILVG